MLLGFLYLRILLIEGNYHLTQNTRNRLVILFRIIKNEIKKLWLKSDVDLLTIVDFVHKISPKEAAIKLPWFYLM